MNYEDNGNNDHTASGQPRKNHLPVILGLAGVAFGALSFGFLITNAIGGNSGAPASVETPPSAAESTIPAPEGTTPPDTGTTPPPSSTVVPPTVVPPTPTFVPPTPTPIPPTPTPTVPPITSPKFHDIYRAEGGQVTRNKTTSLPFRRLEANWDNSYKGCPGAGCIRGRAGALTAVGPLGTGESLVASGLVYNTFVAQRSNANLLMDLRWNGSLGAVVGVGVNTGVEIEIIVSEIDPKTNKTVKAVPNMPYSVVSKELGLDAIKGVDTLKVEGSRSVNIPLKLDPGHLYRIDLKITCSTRAALSLSATVCGFSSTEGFAGVEWTKQVIEYDTGICSPTQKGDGCIYQKN